MVTITFTCGGSTLSESVPLDFGTVMAGEASEIKSVVVKNTGASTAEQCVIRAVEATTTNGFSSTTQSGTASETYSAQTFSSAANGTYYASAYIGEGANYGTSTGGSIATNGSYTYYTKWTPPSSATAGNKVWGNEFSCVYV